VQQIGDLLRNFNQSIQEESKDRKYRFVVKKLMKAHLLNLDKNYQPRGVMIDDARGVFVLHTEQEGREDVGDGGDKEGAAGVICTVDERERAARSARRSFFSAARQPLEPVRDTTHAPPHAAPRPPSATRPGRPRAIGARARGARKPSATSQAREGAQPKRAWRARQPAHGAAHAHAPPHAARRGAAPIVCHEAWMAAGR